VAVVDTRSLEVLTRVDAGDFPDGLAYAPGAHKVFVSDERGGMEIVVDADTNRRLDGPSAPTPSRSPAGSGTFPPSPGARRGEEIHESPEACSPTRKRDHQSRHHDGHP
jgi:hypothetical protein